MLISWSRKSKTLHIGEIDNNADRVIETDASIEAIKRCIPVWESMAVNVKMKVGELEYTSS